MKSTRGIVLDNGADSIKVGLASSLSPYEMPNAVMRVGTSKKVYIGDELISSDVETNYAPAKWWKRPMDRGVVVDWALEQKIWDRAFHKSFQSDSVLKDAVSTLSFGDFGLTYTEAPLIPPMLQQVAQEVVFELYGFDHVYRCSPASLTLYNQRNIHQHQHVHPNTLGKSPCAIVVDSGYSFTHIMPFIGNTLIQSGIKRINIGGKMLDNYLKEVISLRQWNVVEESFLMKHIKEQLGFVSLDFPTDLKLARNTKQILQQWVLPTRKGEVGHLKTPKTASTEQTLRMNNERFSIPELLFHPSLIGGPQAGIVDSIIQCVESCPEEMHEALYSNVLLCGGNVQFPNFRDRVYADLRSQIPSNFDLSVTLVDNPVQSAWQGGAQMQRDSEVFEMVAVTRQQYEEVGPSICDSFQN